MRQPDEGDRGRKVPTVLLVDDQADLRHLMTLALSRSARFEVVGECGDGDTAVEMAADLQPDIVILDILMPGLDGRQALPAILVRAPRTMVVVLSALSAADEAGTMLARGAFAYLEKADVATRFAERLEELYAEFTKALTGETVVAPAWTQPAAGAL